MIRRLLAAVRAFLDPPQPRLDVAERETLGLDEHADQAIANVADPDVDKTIEDCGPDCAECKANDVEGLITSVQADVEQVLAERRARGSRNLRSVK